MSRGTESLSYPNQPILAELERGREGGREGEREGGREGIKIQYFIKDTMYLLQIQS